MNDTTTEVLKVFKKYLQRNTIYENQVASSVRSFRRSLMNPVLELIKKMEAPEC